MFMMNPEIKLNDIITLNFIAENNLENNIPTIK